MDSRIQEKQSLDFDEEYDKYLCPITGEIMEDPVIAPDGYTYERKAIEEWIGRSGTSPMTREPMNSSNLVTNRLVKEEIKSIQEQGKHQIKSRSVPLVQGKYGKLQIESGELDVNIAIDPENYMMVSVGLPDPEEAPPVDICCVVDVSDSMQHTAAGITDGKTEYIELGYSLLDLVKHALKTIALTMREKDRLALITFNESTTTEFDFTEMGEFGKKQALKIIEKLRAHGGTNIYKSLQTATNLISQRNNKSRNASILFFTDGQPNYSPARGEIEAMKKLKRQMKFTHPIHTMGFGMYDIINSYILMEVAANSGGFFSHINNAQNVGTIFVNAIANIMTTSCLDVKLTMKFNDGSSPAAIDEIMIGKLEKKLKGDTLTADLGSIRFGQNIDFLIKFKNGFKIVPENFCDIYLSYES